MATASKTPATYADLLAVPEHLVAEILGGELLTSPRPGMRHARASSRLGVILGRFELGGGEGDGGWWIVDEPELHLGADVVVPDLAGWRRERLPEYPVDAAAMELPPDWACEVLSPSTERVDRQRKLPVYYRERVRHVWLVNAFARTLEVLRHGPDGWVLLDVLGEEPACVEPFETLRIDPRLLWGDEPATPNGP